MPKITRWFIKSGMIYFVLGIVLAFIAELPSVNTGALLLPVYWHMLVLGWITQIIMGVSIWMFPRKRRDQKKKDSLWIWLAFWSLNVGLMLRFTAEPFIPFFTDNGWITGFIITSSGFQVVAIVFYITEIWPRVQSKLKSKGMII
jgi:hypothetical protein